jgi:hypothetical protein
MSWDANVESNAWVSRTLMLTLTLQQQTIKNIMPSAFKNLHQIHSETEQKSRLLTSPASFCSRGRGFGLIATLTQLAFFFNPVVSIESW